MNSFVSDAMSNENNNTAAIDYLCRPHAAQVVSIWLLLNFEHADYQILENHFVEILTGEGKLLSSRQFIATDLNTLFSFMLLPYSHATLLMQENQ